MYTQEVASPPIPQAPNRDAYLLREVAARLGGVSMRTIYKWEEKDGLRITRVAGRPMVFHDDLQAFVANFRRAV